MAAALAGILLAACSIQTKEEAASTSTTATVVVGPTTTIPPEERPAGLAQVSVELTQLAQYSVPLMAAAVRPGSESIYVASRGGSIYEIKRDARRDPKSGYISYTVRPQTSDVAGVSGQVLFDEGADWGLHGFAFSTDGSRLYIAFTNHDAKTQVVELRVSSGRVSPTSQRTLLEIENPDRNHNAGPIAIGSDGFLHITLGDGGGEGDPFETAQDPHTFAGSVLRIDPETGGENPYNIPVGNPYYDTAGDEDGQDEIYFVGVRDPAGVWWDPLTRDGWILDRGEDGVQEVNHLEWEGQPMRGGNLGWPLMNGTQPFDAESPIADDIEPIFEYGPDAGCEIVGGAAYHGSSIPGLDGAFVFGDRCTGRLLALKVEEGKVTDYGILPVGVPENTLSAISTTPDGELIVITDTGTVSQLMYLPPAEQIPAG